MDAALILAGLTMGIVASPHCVAMCGAPCAALTSGCARSASGFHLGRLLGYSAAGAIAAGSVSALGAWSQIAPALRPLWTLLHLAFLALGLWWLTTGRQPHWMKRNAVVPVPVLVRGVGQRGRPVRASLAGLAWVAWPCGALQAALLNMLWALSCRRLNLIHGIRRIVRRRLRLQEGVPPEPGGLVFAPQARRKNALFL